MLHVATPTERLLYVAAGVGDSASQVIDVAAIETPRLAATVAAAICDVFLVRAAGPNAERRLLGIAVTSWGDIADSGGCGEFRNIYEKRARGAETFFHGDPKA